MVVRRARAVNPDQPVVGCAEVAVLLGWDARKVAVYARRGVLPEPVAWLSAGPIWRREAILRWAAERDMVTATQKGQAGHRAEPVLSDDAPSRSVRFVSQYRGLVLFGAPNVGAVRFVGGVFETTNPALVEWLRRHPGYGVDFHEAAQA